MNPLGLLALCYSIAYHLDPEDGIAAAQAHLDRQNTGGAAA